jgi:DNA-directed RNA polymerase subunit alpha
MSTLSCIETYKDKEQNIYGCFLIEPLEVGQGITLGNALRRTLLSDLTSLAITGVRVNNLKHEFASIQGIREDVLEIILNLKEIVFKNSFHSKKLEKNFKFKGFLNVQGPVIVTAGMLNLPQNIVKIINPNQYICTITDNSEFYLEIDIENGKGYRLTDENRKRTVDKKFQLSNPSTLFVDALFMPIKKVNYKVKLIHDTKGNIKESLNLEVITNGSITPKRAIQEALKVIMNLIYTLFITPEFVQISKKTIK